MAMVTPPSPAPEISGRGLRPTDDEVRQNTRLLIRLRWVAGLGILMATVVAREVLAIDLKTLPLILLGLGVLAYNSALSMACYQIDSPAERVRKLAWVQIILDWGAMAALVHLTGGVTSPAIVFFAIHAALSGTILLPWQTRVLTGLAILMVAGLAWLERLGALPHITIPQLGIGTTLYKDVTFIAAEVLFFGTTLIVLSELVTRRAQLLRQREERIRQLYEARSMFLRVATHELRAPLAAGLSLMRNIELGYAGEFNEQQAAIIKRVSSRLDGLRTLIDDLLTLASSQEANVAQMPLERVNVRDVLQKIVERERPSAEAKHITLNSQLDPQPGWVMAGDVGMAIILGNLINNAIKYTPDGGQVTVSYSLVRLSHTVEIVVRDTGIGIPADELPNIFNEFFRARNVKAAQINGTGIGLSTVRTLVDRYHGSITLQSEEGQGTTVRVSLPLS